MQSYGYWMSASRATIPHAKAASFLGGFLLSGWGGSRRSCKVGNGWIKLNRKLLQSPCFQNRELLQLWIWLLLSVNHEEGKAMIGNQIIKVSSGQTLTGRNKIAEATGLNSSKVERLLKVLEIEQQIEQQTFTKYRIITVTNWNKYQIVEQQSEQQVNNKRTASEHKQEGKEGKEKPSCAFDEFWKAYPKKKNKGQAEKAWSKIKQPSEILQQILEALKWQKASQDWTKENGQFIPHPATYLNGRAWEDERPQPQLELIPALRGTN